MKQFKRAGHGRDTTMERLWSRATAYAARPFIERALSHASGGGSTSSLQRERSAGVGLRGDCLGWGVRALRSLAQFSLIAGLLSAGVAGGQQDPPDPADNKDPNPDQNDEISPKTWDVSAAEAETGDLKSRRVYYEKDQSENDQKKFGNARIQEGVGGEHEVNANGDVVRVGGAKPKVYDSEESGGDFETEGGNELYTLDEIKACLEQWDAAVDTAESQSLLDVWCQKIVPRIEDGRLCYAVWTHGPKDPTLGQAKWKKSDGAVHGGGIEGMVEESRAGRTIIR